MAVKRPNWRAMTWVVLAWNVLAVIWLVSGLVSVAGDSDCATEHPVVEINPAAPPAERLAQARENVRNFDLQEACETGTTVGTGLGVAFIIFLWVAGDAILGVIWLVTRKPPAQVRSCPVCGRVVPTGDVVCSGCGYDYRTQQQGPIPEPAPIWPPPQVTERRRR